MPELTYDSENLKLTESESVTPLGTSTLEDIPQRYPIRFLNLADTTPIIQKLFHAALFDVESNLVYLPDGRRYFTGGKRGKGWNGLIFPRDIAYSGLLGINRFYPRVMLDAYDLVTQALRGLERKNPVSHAMDHIDDEVLDVSFNEFKEKYGIAPYSRNTDAIVVVWALEDLLTNVGMPKEETEWAYNFSVWLYDTLCHPLLDTSDGLYYGQSSFLDIGVNGYPEDFGRNPPHVENEHSPCVYNRALKIKATSTNCLYARGFDALAKMADTLGKTQDSKAWRNRAADIRQNIYEQLRFQDGTFSQFKHQDGQLEPRQHVLAAAFVVLADVVSGNDAVKAVNSYPVTEMGVPLHDPFYPNEEMYHNNAAWPFCDALFLKAREKALNVDESGRHFALLAAVFKNGSYHEWVNFLNKTPAGPAQLWSAAPFLGRAAPFLDKKSSNTTPQYRQNE